MRKTGDQRRRRIIGPDARGAIKHHFRRLDLASRAGLDFEIDAEATVDDDIQRIFQRGNTFAHEAVAEPMPGIQLLNGFEIRFRHKTGSVGAAAQLFIVKNDWHAVFCQLDVDLDPFNPQIGRSMDGGQRILRRIAARAAVTDDFGDDEFGHAGSPVVFLQAV